MDRQKQLQELKKWQSRFRVLKDWEITLDDTWDMLRSQVHTNEIKKATIGTGQKDLPDNYILHEVLHIAIKAAHCFREDDEILVQDLTGMLTKLEEEKKWSASWAARAKEAIADNTELRERLVVARGKKDCTGCRALESIGQLEEWLNQAPFDVTEWKAEGQIRWK